MSAPYVLPALGVLLQAVVPLQDSLSPRDSAAPGARAVELRGDVAIDGRLDEAAWTLAPPVTQFVQREPVEGAAPEESTEVRVLFYWSAIYVSARLYDRQPERIGTQLVRRDEWGAYDYFEVSFDPNNDRRTGYRFRVSAAGVQRDVYLFDDTDEDEAWDAVWESAARRDSSGWTAELRIPLSQLRYRAADTVQAWGVNFTRRRLVNDEVTDFALESRVRHGTVSLFGRLEGLRLPHAARRIELRPYAVASARLAPSEPGDPFFNGAEFTPRSGMDLRYGLGSAFSLDATLAPDFGQVEVDPAVINLTAFETFFQERRPFFVEDAQVFDFGLSGGSNRLFYSRRVGREPHGSPPDDADFEHIPSATTILGAAKLTGRTSSGLSVGALAALTSRETGRSFIAAQQRQDAFTVEPRSGYGVARVRQDFRDGASQAGAILTALVRDLPSADSLSFLPSDAYSAGVDFEHNWGGARSRDWALWGFAAGSLVRGSPDALLRIQRASNHYFQRPDATRYAVDSTATSMTGREWRLQFERRSARHWTGAVWLGEITPGFEINDLGFSTAGERLDGGARIEYQQITPGKLFRNYQLSLFTFQNWRHEALDDVWSTSSWTRAHRGGEFSLEADVEFLNFWGANLELQYSPPSQSSVATRGGPLMLDPATTGIDFRLNTDQRRAFSLEPSVAYEHRARGGYGWEAGLELSLRPSPSVELELSPEWSRELDPAQYVATAGTGFAPTYGRRYLFADLRRQELVMDTRVNVTLSPKLTFQLYAQPLLSSGDYLTYKQLARPESFDFEVFTEGVAVSGITGWSCAGGQTCKDPSDRRYVDFDRDGQPDFSFRERDFNVRSLRVNAVMRWEYRPGSTLFLVWQQGREDEVTTGTAALGRDFRALWSADAENVFIVKLTYWFGL
ncbi:MAG: hypothetical protein A3K13_08450 [Gemmatimonadetes bacterium RIFCSPLOWO2_12_FULL_68_9]|nr:MAG: hypothetical protein A3K13_08450 [Gemmatimonadetes bacterium RIFCSPLOWO2_12_FULL_68_9]